MLREIDLELKAGQIVGVAGVSGNGQGELGDVVLGLLPIVSGHKWLFGEDVTRWSVTRLRAAGVAYVPENPAYMAVAPGLTLAENFAVASPARINGPEASALTGATCGATWKPRIAASSSSSLIRDCVRVACLGGTSKGSALARELGRKPRVVVAVYPTRGLEREPRSTPKTCSWPLARTAQPCC